jgi:hypothetical protein
MSNPDSYPGTIRTDPSIDGELVNINLIKSIYEQSNSQPLRRAQWPFQRCVHIYSRID